ncbi:hypothetical protein M758_5G024000 [Ceratodon purpureus]|nr:hypothetical protein M758_5G024000 [Ceratodon purpureus]
MEFAHAAHQSMSPVSLHKPTRIPGIVSCSLGRRDGVGVMQPKRQVGLRDGGKKEVKREVQERLGSEQLLKFEREGHVCVRGLFDEEEMGALAAAVSGGASREKLNAYRHRVAVLCPGVDPFSLHSVAEAEAVIRQQGTDELGFLQCFNLHQKSEDVRRWASHPRLVAMVADLLGAKKVRLYQDCLFQKMPGFGVTNWHSDLNMVPLDTNSFLTVWIPLRSLDKTDSSLHFASGSHRDFALAYWQNNQGMANLESRGYSIADYPCMALGDVSIHHGWTLHWAPEQPGSGPARAAWTVSYFADGARILESRHARRKLQEEDGWSYRAWRKDMREGQVARHPLLPLVYPPGVDNAKQHKGVRRKR